MAERRADWAAAEQFWRDYLSLETRHWFAHAALAKAVWEQARFDEAEALLLDNQQVFPQDHWPFTDFARVAARRRDWTAALTRWAMVEKRFPDRVEGYLGNALALRELGQFDEAETILRTALQRFPKDIGILRELAWMAERRSDWAAAEQFWRSLTELAPDHPIGFASLANILRQQGRIADAIPVIEVAMRRFSNNMGVANQYGLLLAAQERWQDALGHFEESARLFGSGFGFDQRILEVRMQMVDAGLLSEEGGQKADRHVDLGAASNSLAEGQRLVMQFESLGGDHPGCEFGLFQRSLSAEPMGLLRWTTLSQDTLSTLLETEFYGVGDPQYTVLEEFQVGVPFWKINDTRFYMSMQTFVEVSATSQEKMTQSATRRMRFLSRKLVADLKAEEKIFTYRSKARNPTNEELDRLVAGIRRYGNATLFYIRYSDENHPPGIVEFAGPGLLIGYLDRFMSPSHAASESGDPGPTNVHKELLALCRQAYDLWQESTLATVTSDRT